MQNTVDGKLSLDEQNNALNFHQQQHQCKVVRYVKDEASTDHQNIATSEEVPLGEPIPRLRLVVVSGTVSPGATFEGNIFVNSTETHVAGIHGN